MQTAVQGFRLSPQQKNLWPLLESGLPLHAQCTVAVAGELDPEVLRAALDRVVARHEILRTVFRRAPGIKIPVQVVLDETQPRLRLVDLRERAAADRDREVRDLARQERRRPFDLELGPLLRSLLITLTGRESRLVLTLPAVCADPRTLDNLVREIAGACAGAPLTEETVQYVQFSEWEHSVLKDEEGEEGRRFWAESAAGTGERLRLPFTASLPARRKRSEPGRVPVAVVRDLRESVDAFLQDSGATLRDLLMAAWQILLGRLTRAEVVTIDLLDEGRKFEELGEAMGPFAKPVPVSGRFRSESWFGEALAEVSKAAAEAREWWEHFVPAEGAASPSIGFDMVSLPAAPSLTGGDLRLLEIRAWRGDGDLDLVCVEQGAALWVDIVHDTDLYPAAEIARLADQLSALLAGLAENPERRIGDLPVLGEAERRQLLVEINDTAAAYPSDRTVHELFAEVVARCGNAVAVEMGEERWTFDELGSRARRLARRLRGLGVGPEERVGLHLERSPRMLAALFGVLEAGGAYVPLEPGAPRERLARIVREAGLSLVLTEPELAAALEGVGGRLLLVDAGPEGATETEPEEVVFGPAAAPGNLAYVLHTSGSTGTPKGVMVPHRGLVNYLTWCARSYQSEPGDGAPVHSPLGFDLTVTSLLGPLLAGQRVVLVPETEGVEGLTRLLERRGGFSFLKITPAHLEALSLALPLEAASGRAGAFVIGGEALLGETLAFWRTHAPETRLINEYGPTETVVGCCVYEALAGEIPAGPVPIGRPIANTRAYLLDANLTPVPTWAIGELYIGGDGVARGYLDRPDLTAARFVPDAWSEEPGARLYRTGDLARFLPGGQLEYAGRTDNQVKIRGFRVELGEIEAVLASHPAVREAAVVLREEEGRPRRLVGYVVPRAGEAPATALREHLAAHLPEHMIPAALVTLPALPLTPNGKVDRRALPAPETVGEARSRSFVPPRNAAEEKLAAIWAEVLRVERVGVHDNFFELGGDSILSIQIVSRASRLGISLVPRQLFDHPTLAELATVAGTLRKVQAAQGPVVGPVVLTPIQHWFFDQELPDPHHFNLSVLLSAREELGPAALRGAVGALLVHHDALRLRFAWSEGAWRQVGAAPESEVPFTRLDLSALPAERQPEAVRTSAALLQAGLDLAAGPLLRVALMELGSGRAGRLFLAAHHLAVDGVSWRILLEDMETAYRQLAAGAPVALPPKTTSFQQWAARLVEHAQSTALDQEIEIWTDESRRVATRLPVDRTEGANTVGSARSVTVSLGEDETRALLQDVPKAYRTTIDEALLAALLPTLGRWASTRAVLVDLEGHGREPIAEDLDISRTVGWFTSVFPVRFDLLRAPTPGDSLKFVKEQIRAIPGRGLGYGLLRFLRRDAELARELRRQPRAEVSFNYLGQLDQALPESSPFAPAPESAGPDRAPGQPRPYLLEIHGGVLGGQLRMVWTYSENRHDRITVERLAQGFVEALRDIVRYCLEPGAGGYTPSDFPLAGLQLETLERLVGAACDIDDIYPLTPLQQGLLFHSLHAPEEGLYVIQLSSALSGGLDLAAFERAWREAIDRHPILRTGFGWEVTDEPVQIVRTAVELPLVLEDARGLSPAAQEERLATYLAEDRARGFDLSHPPLLRLCLIREDDDRYRFVWSHHHLLLDGWSMPLLVREVFALYEAFSQGTEPASARPRPFRDYVAWLLDQSLAEAEAFWRRTLSGMTAPPVLLKDFPAAWALEAPPAWGEQRIRLSAETTAALQALCRQQHLTLNTVLQGAWALLLARHTDESDVVFGAVTSGRPAVLEGVDEMMGLFINTLPVRVQAPSDAPLVSWLERLQAGTAEARQYEHTPLSAIQAWSQVPRGQQLFESILVFENYPVDDSLVERSGSLRVHDVRFAERTSSPLTVISADHPQMPIEIMFDGRLFHPETVSRLLRHLQTLLEGCAADPRRLLADLPLMSEAERHQLLVTWNDTCVELPGQECLHRLIEAQVDRVPDDVAVVFANDRLTYRELDRKANRLAHHLQSLGVGPEVLVGLCMERSPEMMIGLLAILKAGGAYVPLDPSYPRERLAFMFEDSRAPVLLSQRSLLEKLPATGQARVILLDEIGKLLQGESPERLQGPVLADHPAYAIYTSGSTGQPKGAVNTHRAIVNRLLWMQSAYGLTAADAVLQKTPVSFDVSVWELFWPLLTGARLVLAKPGGHQDSSYLVSLIAAERVTTLHFVPAMLQVFLDEPELPRCTSLRRVICSGEALPAELERRFFDLLGELGVELHNLYGPTEAAVDVTFWACDGAERRSVPIGRPIANTRIYIVDREGIPVPVGVAGELHIGGVALARGYLDRMALTAEKFVPHPYGSAGERLYRTGDLARFLAGGEIEFLGRIDHQVKIRGIRIELGEIERVLDGHPAVREAVAVVQRDPSGDQRLGVYFVPAGDAPSVGVLRAYLAERLPEAMVPATLMQRDALPLTSSGKVDRKALSEAGWAAPERSAFVVPPRDTWELRLVRLWEKVLDVRPVGVTESFFDLGGHSILAVRLMAEIRHELGCQLSLSELFQGGTIERLAVSLRRQQAVAEAGSPLVEIQAGRSGHPLFCIHPAGGNVLCYVELARALGVDQPVYGLEAPGWSGAHEPVTTVESEAVWGLEEIRRVQPKGPYRLAGWSYGGLVAYEMARQLRAAGEPVEIVALFDTAVPSEMRDVDDSELLAGFLGEALVLSPAQLRALGSLDEQLAHVVAEGSRRSLLPPDFGLEQARRYFEIGKANFLATHKHKPGPYAGRAVLFRALEIPDGATEDETLGWGGLVDGLEIVPVPGRHATVLAAENIHVLTAYLRRCLES